MNRYQVSPLSPIVLIVLSLLAPITAAGSCGGFYDVYGSGCPGGGGSTPTLAGTGCPQLGGNATLVISNHPRSAVAFLVMGKGHASLPFTPGCPLQVTELYTPPIIALPLSDRSRTEITCPIVNLSAPEIFLQVVILDLAAPHGYSATNPLELNIGI